MRPSGVKVSPDGIEPTLATSVSVKPAGVTAEAGFSWSKSSGRNPANRPATTASRMGRSVFSKAVTLTRANLTVRFLAHAVAGCSTALSKPIRVTTLKGLVAVAAV
jgi:hypothetical protein